MSIQPDPPIQLDPSMDDGHRLAFINQNFLSISNFLKSNSFKIIQTGTGTMPSASYTLAANKVGMATANSQVAHNLGYTPICLGFLTGFGGVGQSAVLPYFSWLGSAGISAGAYAFEITADNTYVYFTSSLWQIWETAATGTFTSPANYAVKYYLLAETAV